MSKLLVLNYLTGLFDFHFIRLFFVLVLIPRTPAVRHPICYTSKISQLSLHQRLGVFFFLSSLIDLAFGSIQVDCLSLFYDFVTGLICSCFVGLLHSF